MRKRNRFRLKGHRLTQIDTDWEKRFKDKNEDGKRASYVDRHTCVC